MGLFNKTETRSQQASPTASPIMFLNGNNNISYLLGADSTKQLPAIFAVISQLSSDLNAIQWRGHKVAELLNKDLSKTFRELLLSGNAYLFIDRAQNGVVKQLVPIDNQDVTIIYDKGIVSYRILNNSQDEPYESRVYTNDEIISLKINAGTQGLNKFIGTSPLTALDDVIKNSALANQQIQGALKENISPRVLLKTMADASSEARTAIKNAFVSQNDSKVWVTDSQVEVSKLFLNSESSNDSLTNLSKQLSKGVDEVARAFGVPSNILGNENSGDAQSSATEIRQQYVTALVNLYLNPVLFELKEKLSNDLVADTTILVPQKNTDVISDIVSLVTNGILTADEAHLILIEKGILNGE